MITENAKKDAENVIPKSEAFKLQHAPNTSLRVTHRCTLGSTEVQTFCVRFDPNDKYIATGCGDGTIKIYNVLTGKLSYVLNANMPEPMPTTSIRWRPSNSASVAKNVLITVNANGSVQHWHTTSGKLIHTIYDEMNQLYTADYNFNGTQFATAGKDKVVRIYDEATKKLVIEMAGSSGQPGHSNRVFSVKFDKEDENMLVSGGWDNTIQIWDLRGRRYVQLTEGGPVRYIYGPYVCGDGLDIMEGYVVSGSWRTENQVQVWDLETGALCDTIDFEMGFKSPEPCMVYSVQFRKGTGDLILAGGSESNEARLFDRTNAYKPICTIADMSRACYNVDFSNKGDMFALGGGDGVVRCFNIQPAGFN